MTPQAVRQFTCACVFSASVACVTGDGTASDTLGDATVASTSGGASANTDSSGPDGPGSSASEGPTGTSGAESLDDDGGTSGADSSSTGGGAHEGDVCSVTDLPVRCTLYVAPDGSDAASGAADAPLRSVPAALDQAGAGDTICLRDGTYPGFDVGKSGAEGAPITIRNEPGHSPQIVTDRTYHGVNIEADEGEEYEIGWLVFAGDNIHDTSTDIKMYNGHEILIEGNNIHDNENQGIGGGAVRLTINANVIARNGHIDTTEALQHGIYMGGGPIVVSNNLIVGNAGYGIQVAGYPYDPAKNPSPDYGGAHDWLIINNTIVDSVNRPAIVLWQPGTVNATIANNIFARNGYAGAASIEGYSEGGGHVMRNNVYDSPALTSNVEDYADEDNLGGDPMLVSESDHHLLEGSPAIGAGSMVDAPKHDHEQRLRHSDRNDAGALQYCP